MLKRVFSPNLGLSDILVPNPRYSPGSLSVTSRDKNTFKRASQPKQPGTLRGGYGIKS